MENPFLVTSKEYLRKEYQDILKDRKERISVAMPVTGEDGSYCFYSLPLLSCCPIDELIILLDRPHRLTTKIVDFYKPKNIDVTIVIRPWRTSWKHSIAKAFSDAFDLCTGDYIFTMAADILTDPLIYNKALFQDADLLSFRYHQLTMGPFPSLSDKLSNFWSYLPWVYSCDIGKFSGHFAMKRSVWEKIRFKDVASPDLQFFNDCARAGISHRYYPEYNITHLRSGNVKLKQISQANYRYTHDSFLKTLAHGFLNCKIDLLAEYFKLKLA